MAYETLGVTKIGSTKFGIGDFFVVFLGEDTVSPYPGKVCEFLSEDEKERIVKDIKQLIKTKGKGSSYKGKKASWSSRLIVAYNHKEGPMINVRIEFYKQKKKISNCLSCDITEEQFDNIFK